MRLLRLIDRTVVRWALLVLLTAAAASCGGGSGAGGQGGPANLAPSAVAVATPEAGQIPLVVLLDGRGSSDADGRVVSYRWSFEDGTSASGATISRTFNAPGTYPTLLTITDDEGATATATVNVRATASAPPVARAAANPDTGNAPLAVTLSAAGSTDPDGIIVQYQWDFGDGSNPANGTVVNHTFERPGSYEVTLRVLDDAGLSATTSLQVQVNAAANQPPQASFTATPDIGAAPLQAQFDASASSDPDGRIVDFRWDFGDGSVPQSGAIVVHSFASNGVYQVRLTVTDEFGAAASTTRTVIAGIRPVARITASTDSGTPPLTVQFDGSSSTDADGSVVTFEWDFDDEQTATGATPTHTFEDPGEYLVSLIVSDNDGIRSQPVTFMVEVTQDPASLSFRDFFNTNSVGQYDVAAGSGQSVSYDANGRMRVITDLGTVEISRSLPAEEEAFYRIRFQPTQANTSAATFVLRLEEDDTTYYEVFGVASPGAGEPSGGLRKVVNGVVTAGGEALYTKPGGYTNGLAYSVNVYFSPGQVTAEFTELRPRVLSISPSDGTPIKVARMKVMLQDQNAFLDDIVKEPIGPATLQYYVAFGDSITEGVGDDLSDDGRGYPIEMQREFQENLITSHVVFNEGVGGMRTDQALTIVGEMVARHPRAQFVTVQLGTNDALQNTATTAQFKANVQSILDVITGAGKTPYIARLPHAITGANGRIDGFNQALDELAQENGLIVVPPDFQCVFDANPSLMGADRIHPTGAGYAAMARLWYKLIDLGQAATPADACTLP